MADEPQNLRAEMLDKMSALVTAAFGLVAALAWNDAIQSLFAMLFPGERSALVPKAGYAVLVTIVAVILVIWVGRAAGKAKARLGGPRSAKPA